MDLLKLIKGKTDVFVNTDSYLGLQSVIRHIEIADNLTNRALGN